MTVTHKRVSGEEDGLRLDRWFKINFPQVTHAYVNKLLRTGQVRLDGARVKGNARLEEGQEIRIPPLNYDPQADGEPGEARSLTKQERAFFQSLVIFEDKDLYVLNKPAGLAVQGGTKTTRHLDALLEGLAGELDDRPRLVHRLDRDTSGVLVVAKRRSVASALGRLFVTRSVRKIYWALVKGVPKPPQGKVDKPLVKASSPEGDRVRAAAPGEQQAAQHAVTHYSVVDRAAHRLAWVSLKPVTGRQHQLRAHMAILGTPILGDNKYGGDEMGEGTDLPLEGIENRLHLHARRISFPHPRGGTVDVTAPLPEHMKTTFEMLGFDAERYDASESDD